MEKNIKNKENQLFCKKKKKKKKINFIKKGKILVEVKRSEKVKKLKKKEGVKEEVASKRKEYQEYKREECQQ